MRRAAAIITAILCLLAVSCRGETVPLARTFAALDTVCTVKLYDGGSEALLQEAVEVVAELEALWSRTVPTSDVARLNAADGEAVALSEETGTLLERAQYWAAKTDGAFDVTVAPYKTLWETATHVPSAQELAAARERVGSEKLKALPWRLTDGAQLDLGAIAKGAIADEVRERLKAKGCRAGLLDLGGNITVFGTKADGAPFSVAIADPTDPSSTVLTVAVTDVTLATSGSYERYYELDGKRYSHLLDPATGLPADNDLRSVTVIAAVGADADALSTACFVMGFERARSFVETLDGVEAVFVKTDGEIVKTDGVSVVSDT